MKQYVCPRLGCHGCNGGIKPRLSSHWRLRRAAHPKPIRRTILSAHPGYARSPRGTCMECLHDLARDHSQGRLAGQILRGAFSYRASRDTRMDGAQLKTIVFRWLSPDFLTLYHERMIKDPIRVPLGLRFEKVVSATWAAISGLTPPLPQLLPCWPSTSDTDTSRYPPRTAGLSTIW